MNCPTGVRVEQLSKKVCCCLSHTCRAGVAGGVDEASSADNAGKGKGCREPAMSSIGADTPVIWL